MSSVWRRVLGAWLVASLPLGASAAAVCRLVSGGGLAFGAYDLLATAPRDSQMTLTLHCDGTGTPQAVVLTVRVDQGAHGASVAARRMVHTSGSGDVLAYGIYRDPARSSTWGVSTGVDTVSAMLSVPATGSVATQFILYGRIPARQDARVGSYADAVQVTVDY